MSDIVLPRLGWNMEQGVFMGWLKRDGEPVNAGEALFTMEGDKSVQEIEAVESGIVRYLPNGPREGDTVPVGTLLGRIEAVGQAAPVPTIPSAASPSVRRLARELGVNIEAVPGSGPGGRVQLEDLQTHHQSTKHSAHRKPVITPRARHTAKLRNVDVSKLTGSGRDGRIREQDVLAVASPKAASTQPKAIEQSQAIRPSSLRQTIAERMVHSRNSTAPVTLTTTVDATNLVNLRDQFKTIASGSDLPIPSFTDFFIKLSAIALQKHPYMNARWQDDHIVTLKEINIGLAVDTEAGLLVPVVHQVPARSIRQLAAQTKLLIEKARARRLSADEMQQGTFTVTNLGAFGIDAFTPIINWPECAILGIGAIRQQAMVINNQIVARHSLTLSLTFDHRLVDGAPAARFLQTLATSIENPSAWLLE